MHSVRSDPPKGGGPPSFVSIFIASTLPRVSVHFGRARRAWQKCTETRGKADAINIETKEGVPPPEGMGHNALSALGDLPPLKGGVIVPKSKIWQSRSQKCVFQQKMIYPPSLELRVEKECNILH